MKQVLVFDRLIRWMLFMCLISAVFMIAAPASAGFIKTDFDGIDIFVESQMHELHIPGLALAIVQGDQVMYLHGYGITGPDERPVTPKTPFILGSTTKSFTALAIMQLVEDGKIELDAPVQRYIPWFRVADSAASTQITVRNLLNQTSGISTADGNGDFTQDDSSDNALQRRVDELQTVQLSQPVGATFQYSNVNYDLLGLLVETVSGQFYEEYIQQEIFTPLEMHHSATSLTTAQSDGLATGYHYWFDMPFAMRTPFPRGSLPSGYLISSAEDMSHYLIAQMNNGQYGDTTILSPQGIVQLHLPAIETREGNQYAMGWFVDQSGETPTLWHNGTVPGFNVKMILVPNQGWGVVVLMNASSQVNETRKEAIADGVISLLQGRTPKLPPPNRMASVLYAIIIIVAIIPLANVLRSLWELRKWSENPSQRPQGGRLAWRIANIVGGNLLIALLFLIVQPQFFGISLRGTLLLSPEIGTIMIASIIIALGWAIIYPFLFRQLQGHRSTPDKKMESS